MPAVLFGSISSLADTSELQREAFNQAFEEHRLGWTWRREGYVSLLERSGGQDRIAAYARSQRQEVDTTAVHATKSRIFQQSLASADVGPRPGVVETIAAAKRRGMKVALVTTTSADNVAALLAALSPLVQASDFDLVVDATSVNAPKPDPAAYRHALHELGEQPQHCVAVEDNLGGVEAAVNAGLPCVAFPNINTAGHLFNLAVCRVEELDVDAVLAMAPAGAAA